jgi:hypothetical protein
LNPMEHYVAAGHVCQIGQCPRRLLCDAWDYVEEDLEAEDEDGVDEPGSCTRGSISMYSSNCGVKVAWMKLVVLTLRNRAPVSQEINFASSNDFMPCMPTFRIHPFCIQVRQGSLIT